MEFYSYVTLSNCLTVKNLFFENNLFTETRTCYLRINFFVRPQIPFSQSFIEPWINKQFTQSTT